MTLFQNMGIDGSYLIIILFILLIGMFIYCVSLKNMITRYKKRQDIFLQGSDGKSLEKAILQKFKQLDNISELVKENNEAVKQIESNGTYAFQKFSLHKYDAFEGMGGKLSFTLCVLTDNNDGFILSSVHNEIGGCFTYVKEVIRGEAYVVLSKEEKAALEEARNRRSSLDDYQNGDM